MWGCENLWETLWELPRTCCQQGGTHAKKEVTGLRMCGFQPLNFVQWLISVLLLWSSLGSQEPWNSSASAEDWWGAIPYGAGAVPAQVHWALQPRCVEILQHVQSVKFSPCPSVVMYPYRIYSLLMYLCLISEGNFVLHRGLKIFLRRNFCLELLPLLGIQTNLDVKRQK